MAFLVAHLPCNMAGPLNFYHHYNYKYQIGNHRNSALFSCIDHNLTQHMLSCKRQMCFASTVTCSASNKPSPSTDVSFTAKIRSEVLSPFRTVRMFFYLAFIASGALGGLIATTQLIAALANPSRAAEVAEILKGLGIDIGAATIFAFLYYRENKAKNVQVARLSREESLSNLKLRVGEKKIISVSSLRGVARLVICAGSVPFILESFKLSEPFTQSLLDRGVLVVPFATDGNLPGFEIDEGEEMKELPTKRKQLWQLAPVYVSEWSNWLDEQKKLAGVSPESPVYVFFHLLTFF
ncbi:hypothetical protein OIU78_014799 [Salix suchowensis]|nr:hypothetical protein OIU78_014799 [Salix suchowensis]